MSDFQNSLNKFLDISSEASVVLPQNIKIINKSYNSTKNELVDSTTPSIFIKQSTNNNIVDSATSSVFIGQSGDNQDSATSSVFIGQSGDNQDSATSSVFIGQSGGKHNIVDSATSSVFIGQSGGKHNIVDSATSSVFIGQSGGKHNGGTNLEINKLISMLTTESKGLSETNTETLETQLRDILNQNGGTKKYKQKAGGKTNIEDIKHFFTDLKSQGVNVNVKLNDKTLSEFFNLAQNTTTEIESQKINKMIGGKKSSKKSSKKVKKSSKKVKKSSNKLSKKEGGAGTNPGFQAFLDFKKHVATKLKISNGPTPAKIAGSINSEMKKKYSELSAVEIAKKNTEYFDKNIDKVKNNFKELIEKASK